MKISEWAGCDDIDELYTWYHSRKYREMQRMDYQRIMVANLMWEARINNNPVGPEDVYKFPDDEDKVQVWDKDQLEQHTAMWERFDTQLDLPLMGANNETEEE